MSAWAAGAGRGHREAWARAGRSRRGLGIAFQALALWPCLPPGDFDKSSYQPAAASALGSPGPFDPTREQAGIKARRAEQDGTGHGRNRREAARRPMAAKGPGSCFRPPVRYVYTPPDSVSPVGRAAPLYTETSLRFHPATGPRSGLVTDTHICRREDKAGRAPRGVSGCVRQAAAPTAAAWQHGVRSGKSGARRQGGSGTKPAQHPPDRRRWCYWGWGWALSMTG